MLKHSYLLTSLTWEAECQLCVPHYCIVLEKNTWEEFIPYHNAPLCGPEPRWCWGDIFLQGRRLSPCPLSSSDPSLVTLWTLLEGQILSSTSPLIWGRFSSRICSICLLLFRNCSLRITHLHAGKYHLVGFLFLYHLQWGFWNQVNIYTHQCQWLTFLSQRQTLGLDSDF